MSICDRYAEIQPRQAETAGNSKKAYLQATVPIHAMKNSRQLSETYLKFVNLVSAIRGLPTLDAMEERVLTGLAIAWSKGERVPVLHAMELAPDTSPTTVHRRLKSLRKKGLIELREDQNDSRIKYVLPTSAAQDYFARLGKCLSAAAHG